jgi:hypothetical protein
MDAYVHAAPRDSFRGLKDPQIPRIDGSSAELAAFAPDMGGTHAEDFGLMSPLRRSVCARTLWEVRRKLSSEAEGRYFHGNVQVQNGYSKRPKR